jgi:L-iditol 2-dehydrogenase
MKAVVLEEIGKLIYKEVPKPKPLENEVLLKIKSCGICSSDVDRALKNGAYKMPLILGHEICGEIAETGEQAIVFPLLPCFKCNPCQKENYNQCDNYDYFGSRRNGGFAEYLAVPKWNVISIKNEVTPEQAAICEPMAVAFHAARISEIVSCSNALVIGTGTIGILLAMRLKMLGIEDITFMGRSEKKIEFVKKLGFKQTCRSSKDMSNMPENSASTVFDCAGTNESLQAAILCAEKGAKMVLVGNPANDMNLPQSIYWQILRKELSIKGVWNSSFSEKQNDWKQVIEALETKRLNVSSLITHKFNLSQCNEAFDMLRDKKEFCIKAVFANE